MGLIKKESLRTGPMGSIGQKDAKDGNKDVPSLEMSLKKKKAPIVSEQ